MNSTLASEPELSVSLPTLSTVLSYQNPVRLSQALSDTQTLLREKGAAPTFWLAAQLLEKDKNIQIEQLKANILKKLQLLGNEESESELKAKLLSSFITSHHFNFRHFISLDNDRVRIQKEKNPLLKGKFKLLTPSRTSRIRIIGSEVPEQIVPFLEHASIDDYLQSSILPENSNTSIVYIIQPDGDLTEVSNTYWKRKPVFFTPGAILFVGFNSLPEQYSSLNEQIAELLRYLPPLTKGIKR
jgi:hypothetical protein